METSDQASPPQEIQSPIQALPVATRFIKLRIWAFRPIGCATLFSVIFLVGILVGVGGTLFSFVLFGNGGTGLGGSGVRNQGAIVIQLNTQYLTQIIDKSVRSSGLPGDIKSVQVKLTHNGPITVIIDDQLTLFGLAITRQLTLTLQPVVHECQLQIRMLHVDLAGIPITGFAATFEDQINQQIRFNPSDLPQGFTYCTTGVRTEQNGLYITYSATRN